MNKEVLKKMIIKYSSFFKIICRFYNAVLPFNRIYKKGVNTNIGFSLINGLNIKCKGGNNKVYIEDYSRLKNCSISFYGNNNTIYIKNKAALNQVHIVVEDDNNYIEIGNNSSLLGKTHLAVIEGTKIIIGDNCLLSSDIHFRTGDSHSILDNNNNRINPSKDIIIGNHVWIGTRVICLKGVVVSDNSVVAAGTLLCKKHDRTNCVIGGVPGREMRENIDWVGERIPAEIG